MLTGNSTSRIRSIVSGANAARVFEIASGASVATIDEADSAAPGKGGEQIADTKFGLNPTHKGGSAESLKRMTTAAPFSGACSGGFSLPAAQVTSRPITPLIDRAMPPRD